MKKLILFCFLASVVLAQKVEPPLFGAGGAGGTCDTLGGDVTGTCAANALNASGVVIPNASTATAQAVGDATAKVSTNGFVAAVVASINPAISVQAATTAVLSNTPVYSNGTAGVGATLTAGSFGALTIDGYTVLLNDRVLVKNQASTFQNGVYTLTTLGTGGVDYVLTRATDYNATTNINYTGTIPVLQGSTNSNTGWNGPTNLAAVGSPNAITYTQAAAGNAGGPPGGNVKAQGNLATGNIIEGAGGKTIVDTGTAFTSVVTQRCVFDNDTQSATALVAAQVSGHCVVPRAATIIEVDVEGGTGFNGSSPNTLTGTSSVTLQKDHGGSTTSLLSSGLATASGKACAKTTTSATCLFYNGMTSSNSITVSTTALAAGDVIQVSGFTPDTAQTWYTVTVVYTVN